MGEENGEQERESGGRKRGGRNREVETGREGGMKIGRQAGSIISVMMKSCVMY